MNATNDDIRRLLRNFGMQADEAMQAQAKNAEGAPVLHFRLVVEDRGPGVAPEFVPRLFERFSRSDETRRTGQSGAGLGLSIASAYADAMGGRLEYQDAEPHGARFTLSLPEARS